MVNIEVPFATQIESGQEPGHPTRSGEDNCGPAVLAMLLAWHQVPNFDTSDVSVDFIRTQISGADTPYNQPLQLSTLRDYLMGYKVITVPIGPGGIEEQLTAGNPVLWLGDNSRLVPMEYPDASYYGGHFMVLRGLEGSIVLANDPLLPNTVGYTMQSLIDGWQGGLAVLPNKPVSIGLPPPPLIAPPTMGWQIIGWSTALFLLVVSSKARHVMVLDPNLDYLRRLRQALPDVKVLYRPFLPLADYGISADEAWKRFFTGAQGAELLKLVDEIETPWNEPPMRNAEDCQVATTNNLAWIGLCQKAHKVPITLALAVGNPGDLKLWANLRHVCEATSAAGGYISTHAYSLEKELDSWTINRWSKERQAAPWLSNCPRYITEYGQDSRPYKARGTTGADYGKLLVDQADYWYKVGNDVIKACFPFVAGGNGDKQWEPYRVDDTEAGQIIASAMQRYWSQKQAGPSAKEQARAIQQRAGALAGDLNNAADLTRQLVACVNDLVRLVE